MYVHIYSCMYCEPSCINTHDPHTGATNAAAPGFKFAAWYRLLAKPMSVVMSILSPPISRSIPMAFRPACGVFKMGMAQNMGTLPLFGVCKWGMPKTFENDDAPEC